MAKLLGMPLESVRVIYVRGSGCYGLNGADAVSFDAAVLSQAAGRPVRLQFSRQDEMMWENFGAACVIEHRAALGSDGRIAIWDRENWVASLGNRPGYDRPGNVISGMLFGYEPEPLKPGPAKAPTGKLRNQSNTVPAYFAGCVEGSCGGCGTIRSGNAPLRTRCVRRSSPDHSARPCGYKTHLPMNVSWMSSVFMREASGDFRLHNTSVIRESSAVIQAAAKAAKWEARTPPAAIAEKQESFAGVASRV